MANIIKTEFMSFDDKLRISRELKYSNVPDEIGEYIFNEFQRLEGIIKDYEVGMMQIVGKLESKTFKTATHL